MSDLIIRTAKADFELNGEPVAVGQVVELNALQLRKLADAGCVEASDELNALVPVFSISPALLSPMPVDDGAFTATNAQIAEARQIAGEEIAELDRRIQERRLVASQELDAINQSHAQALADARVKADGEISTINAEILAARQKADVDLAAIADEVSKAREKADTDLADIRKATAKAEKAAKAAAASETVPPAEE